MDLWNYLEPRDHPWVWCHSPLSSLTQVASGELLLVLGCSWMVWSATWLVGAPWNPRAFIPQSSSVLLKTMEPLEKSLELSSFSALSHWKTMESFQGGHLFWVSSIAWRPSDIQIFTHLLRESIWKWSLSYFGAQLRYLHIRVDPIWVFLQQSWLRVACWCQLDLSLSS